MHNFKKNILIPSFLVIFLSGCSLIPRLTFDKPNTVPQKTDKSERQIYHKTPDGEVFKLKEKNYHQEERRLTLAERLGNFISNLKGWVFWIFIVLIIFVPGFAGWLIGSIFNGFRTALTSTVRAIRRAKKNGGRFMEELDYEHKKNKKTKKIINKIRAEQDE